MVGTTEAGYKSYMKFLIQPTLEHLALKDIDHILLANYFAGLNGRCGFWSMQKIRMLLKSIFEEAVNDDLISKNPMRRLPMPNTADPDKPVLEKGDAARVLKAMANNESKTGIRDYAITRIGTFCAVRSAEAFGLLWECDLGKDLFIKHSAPEALMFPSQKPNVPCTSRNWLERNLRPVGKALGIRTPLTFQVLRRSFATHNQKHLKNVQAHLGDEHGNDRGPLCGRDPQGSSPYPERYAAEIEGLVRRKKAGKSGKKDPARGRSSEKLDGTGRAFSKSMSVSY